MGRVKLCGVTIMVVIIFGVTSLIYLGRRTNEIIDLAKQTQTLADNGDKQGALTSAEELEKQWEDYQDMASIFVRNDKISGVQTSMIRLYPLIEKDSEEIDAEFANVISGLEWIVESEVPRVTNIL